MMTRAKPTIGITLGDPAGIGPEVTAKSLAKPAIRNLARFKIVGDLSVYRRYASRIFPNCEFIDLEFVSGKNIRPGRATALSAAPPSLVPSACATVPSIDSSLPDE